MPTAAQRNGNFGSTAIYDPATTRANPSGTGYIRDQFPGNFIPASRLNSLGLSLLNSYPLANVPGSSTLFSANAPQLQDSKNGVLRGDVQVSGKDSMAHCHSRQLLQTICCEIRGSGVFVPTSSLELCCDGARGGGTLKGDPKL